MSIRLRPQRRARTIGVSLAAITAAGLLATARSGADSSASSTSTGLKDGLGSLGKNRPT